MKRDMNLVREILLAVEARQSTGAEDLHIEGYSQEEIGYHVYLMGEEGLLDAMNVIGINSPSPKAMARGLTWQGHDFLEAARNPTMWKKALDTFRKEGVALTLEILKAYLLQKAREKLSL